MNIKNGYIFVLTPNTDVIPAAGGFGFCTEDDKIKEKTVYGLIIIYQRFINNLVPFEEREFIVFHECAHIVNDHTIAKLLVDLPSLYAIVVNLTDKNPLAVMVIEGIRSLYVKLFQESPIDARAMRVHEIEADLFAVRYTRNPMAAVNCFYRLSAGNMNSHSHSFELFGDKFPEITWGERVGELRKLFGLRNQSSVGNR